MARGKGNALNLELAEVLNNALDRLESGTARAGIVFPPWALEIARFATPPQHFPTLILTGRTWPPEEALARGMVDELVEPGELLEQACGMAEELAAIPAAAFAATKLAVRQPMIEAARRQTALTEAAVIEHWCSAETLQQVAAFAEMAIKHRG